MDEPKITTNQMKHRTTIKRAKDKEAAIRKYLEKHNNTNDIVELLMISRVPLQKIAI